MRNLPFLCLSLAWLATLAFGSSAQAEEESAKARLALPAPALIHSRECLAQIRECFARTGNERAQCLYAAAHTSFCEGSHAGRLSLKRWSMNPAHSPAVEPVLGIFGPAIVDRECIANFDNQWSGSLIQGEVSTEDLAKLEAKLDACRRAPANENLRP